MLVSRISSVDCLRRISQSIAYFAIDAIRSWPRTIRAWQWSSRSMRVQLCSIASFIRSFARPKPKGLTGMRCVWLAAELKRLLPSVTCMCTGEESSTLVPGDYNPGNILYHKDSEGKYRFALVDINRFYFGHPTMARCMRSFTQLSGARLSQLVVLIRRYCDVRHWDPKRAWKYFQLYRRSLFRKERIKSKFKSLLGLLP